MGAYTLHVVAVVAVLTGWMCWLTVHAFRLERRLKRAREVLGRASEYLLAWHEQEGVHVAELLAEIDEVRS